MDGQNLAFITNPKAYLERNAVVCYTGEAAQKSDINRGNGNTVAVTPELNGTLEFDLAR